jgi:hypothetical protein
VAMVLVLLLERLSVVLDEKELQLILVQTRWPSPPSYADCLEICESQTPGTLGACSGL